MKSYIFQTVAEPSRRAIFVLLSLKAITPNVITDYFNTTYRAKSKHMRILTEGALVNQE